MSTVIYVSDFDLRGSGYANIATVLCDGLVERHGKDVIALGFGYKGQEHHHPYPIVPATPSLVAHMIKALRMQDVSIEAVVVALDIPLQAAIMKQMQVPNEIPYVGLFPVEGPPLCVSWAMELSRMDGRLVMSRFGKEALAEAGIDSEYIPIGVDPEAWRPALADEREQIRAGLGIPPDDFFVLTVADNQERKNLSAAAEIFARFSLDVTKTDKYGRVLEAESLWPTQWHLVTRPESPIGYKLSDLAMDFAIMDRLMLYNRGMPFKALWSLFVAADAFLLTSKAEGLAMPVLEAMSCRLPVVGTDCCAIHEHLTSGRGLLIKPAYVMTDPWGNSRRYLVDVGSGVRALRRLKKMEPEKREAILDKAQAYAGKRGWDATVDALAEAVEKAKRGKS
jgi:glycosyltransferase involved in cell wall biosynthesis